MKWRLPEKRSLVMLMSNSDLCIALNLNMSLLSAWISLVHLKKTLRISLTCYRGICLYHHTFHLLTFCPAKHSLLYCHTVLEAKISRRCSGGVWSSHTICLLYWATTLQQAAVAVTWERGGQLSVGNWMWTFWVTVFDKWLMTLELEQQFVSVDSERTVTFQFSVAYISFNLQWQYFQWVTKYFVKHVPSITSYP